MMHYQVIKISILNYFRFMLCMKIFKTGNVNLWRSDKPVSKTHDD